MDSVVKKIQELSTIPEDPYVAIKYVLGLIVNEIKPTVFKIQNQLKLHDDKSDFTEAREVFTLQLDQINKCLINLLEVFKTEVVQETYLQESRQYILNRLSACVNTLLTIAPYLEISTSKDCDECSSDSIFTPTMYFVNWIDLTFQVLEKLSSIIYETNYVEQREYFSGMDAYEKWKSDVAHCATELHALINELLLSSMTLSRYCLNEDQYVVKARSRVVLRETKALLSELIQDSPLQSKTDVLKCPIMPSNVNILIDVLKDVLYALETNANTALLGLVIHCFSRNKYPVDVLREHLSCNAQGNCSCLDDNEYGITENCSYVKDFDLYNERLSQIGNFAVSCSSDHNRTLTLRSGLATLESLDTHLVPALIISPQSYHSKLLTNIWAREVQDIRDSIYLIIDPSAFAEKSKQVMQQQLREVLKLTMYNNSDVCAVINTGCMIHEFFQLYEKREPEALAHRDELLVLLANLDKALKECKTVSNLLCSSYDFLYEINMPANSKRATLGKLVKRLKLLYTLVKNIHALIRPQDNDNLFEAEYSNNDQQLAIKNTTHTVLNNYETYINTPKKTMNNISRSEFARSSLRSLTKHIPLSKLTKRLRNKTHQEFSITEQLEHLLNESNEKMTDFNDKTYNKPNDTRQSSRRTVINQKKSKISATKYGDCSHALPCDKTDVVDHSLSLQISDILSKLNDITIMYSPSNITNTAQLNIHNGNSTNISPDQGTNNVITSVNNSNTNIRKHIGNVPGNASVFDSNFHQDNSNVTPCFQIPEGSRLSNMYNWDGVNSDCSKCQLETTV